MRHTKLPNGSLPPVYSIATGDSYFEGIAKHPPFNGIVDEQYLMNIGISPGTIASLLAGLRWSKIIDNMGRLTNPNLPVSLRNPKTRKEVFQEILKTTYPDLLNQPGLQNATLEWIIKYFERHNVKATSSGRAARLFMWMAQQAGMQLAEKIPTPTSRPDVSLRVNSDTPPEIFESQDEDVTDLDETDDDGRRKQRAIYLDILLANLKASKQLPDKDLQEHIEWLLDEARDQDDDIN